ncbi:MAG: hypothetical protein M1831_005814 [Alyxoria varia]|nr:MAG: hypothetical protein M1831_005814 [Alyxoria varia]
MGITSVPLFWTYIEIGTAMVGCCLPCLKPILDRLSIKAITSAFGTKLSSSGQGSKESSSYKMSNVKTPSDGGLPLNSESDTTALTLGPAKLGSGSVRHYAVGEAVQGDRDMHSERVGVRTEMNVYSEYV